MSDDDKLITIAIYTYEKAQIIKGILENENIPVVIQNVNLIQPVISSGVRVRIRETDLPHALAVLEQHPNLDQPYEEEPIENMPKRILVPIDFSDYAHKACEIAFNYAKEIGAEVMLFHAYFSPYYPGAIPMSDAFNYDINEDEALREVQERIASEMRKFTKAIKEKIKNNQLPDIKFKHTVQEGIPEDEIIRFSRQYKPILICMGTRGKNQKEMDLIGSVTAEVLDLTKYPVFAIPENVPFDNLNKVKNFAFFTNFDQRDLIALDLFMRIMKDYEFKINFVHVATKKDTWNEIKLAGIKDYFNKQYPGREANYTMIDGIDFLNSVESFIRDTSIDVLVITSRKRNIFARLFNPSIAHKMLFHTDTALFVLPS